MKLKLTDKFRTPAIDKILMDVIQNCGECLNFGSAHIHALLQPITRRHPFELLVGDYLAMPKGKGGYKEVGLYLDTASQRVFGFKYKTHGSAKTTRAALRSMFQGHAPWETFMSDGGSHFDNEEVRQLCKEFGVSTEVVAKYSPWVNGLVEGTNRILLGILKRMCAPDLGEEGWKKIEKWEHLPANWPDHFDAAIFLLNNRILRALDHTPNELFYGMVINMTVTGVERNHGRRRRSAAGVHATATARRTRVR
jgi:transposase InsO family protein